MGYGKWLRLQRDVANDAVGSVGYPRRIALGGIFPRGVRYYVIKITQLGVNEIELLGFKDSLFFRLGSFGCHIVARVFTLACADEHLLRNLESLVAVQ